jgi:hypothetical protein
MQLATLIVERSFDCFINNGVYFFCADKSLSRGRNSATRSLQISSFDFVTVFPAAATKSYLYRVVVLSDWVAGLVFSIEIGC